MQYSSQNGQLITLFSCKGGSGTTTLASNLAYEIQTIMQEPVALLDLDPIYCNASMLMNLQLDFCLRDLAHNPVAELDDEMFRKVTTVHSSGLHVLPLSRDILDEQPMVGAGLLNRCITYLKSHYKYVIADLPSHILDGNHQLMMNHADTALLVSESNLPALYRTCQYLRAVRQDLDVSKFNLVLNRVNQPGAFGLSSHELERQFGHPVCARMSENRELVIKAVSLGQFLSQVDEKSDLSRSVQNLASSLVDLGLSELTPIEERPTLFGKLSALNLANLMKGSSIHAPSKA